MESRNQMIYLHLQDAERGTNYIGRRRIPSWVRGWLKLLGLAVVGMLGAVWLWGFVTFFFVVF